MSRPALTFQSLEDDDGIGAPSSRQGGGGNLGAQSQSSHSCQRSCQSQGSADSDLVLFRVAHKDLSSMKRPLAAVDDLRSGDIAIKVYVASEVKATAADGQKLSVDKGSRGIFLLRFWDAFTSSAVAQTDLIQGLKIWKHEAGDRVGVDQAIASQLCADDMQLVVEMMACRAFVGSGRSFEVYGSNTELQGFARLRCEGLATKLDKLLDVVDVDDDTGGGGCGSVGDHDQDLQGKWCLTAKAVSSFAHRVRLGSPDLVFTARPGLALQDRSTFELYLHLTASGFKELTETTAIKRAGSKPFSPTRGRALTAL